MNTEKPLYEKINIILGIFASICTIIGTSILGINTYINSQKNENVTDERNKNEYAIDNNAQSNDNEVYNDLDEKIINRDIGYASSKNIGEQSDEKNVIDVEAEVKSIRNKYYSFQNEKGVPIKHTLDSQILIYYASNNSVSIQIPNGYTDIKYSRIYYFDEHGQFYFAFIFDKTKENRLYFKDDILIRYIDENGSTYDINHNLNSCECEWEELALTESYELFNGIN